MGLTVQSIDEILAPYVEKEYNRLVDEIILEHSLVSSDIMDLNLDKVKKLAFRKVIKELEQGLQAMEIAFNTLPSSRGDFVFVTYTFGLGQDEWSRLVAKKIMEVRNAGQGVARIPQLFPKLVYLMNLK